MPVQPSILQIQTEEREAITFAKHTQNWVSCPHCCQTVHSIPRICCTLRWDQWEEQTPNTTPKGTNTIEIAEWNGIWKCQADHKILVIFANTGGTRENTPSETGAVFSQKLNPAVAQMIAALVADGITEVNSVKKALRHRITHYLCKDSPPDPNDRAYFPTHDDLRNHIYWAKQALQHSKYDQENLRLKVQNWKKTHPDANFFSVHVSLIMTMTALLKVKEKVKLIARQENSHRDILLYGFTSTNGRKTYWSMETLFASLMLHSQNNKVRTATVLCVRSY